MPAKNDFPVVFEQLKQILKPYAPELTVTADTSSSYSLDGPYSKNGRSQFSSAQRKSKKITFRSI